MSSIEEYECEKLVKELKRQGIGSQEELNKYVTGKKLGHNYPHIHGIVIAKEGQKEKKFMGVSPQTYAEICEQLNIKKEKSSSKASGFTSYGDLRKKKSKKSYYASSRKKR